MGLTTKPNCILHVGMQKTGSSSIQKTLCNLNTPEFEYLSLSNLDGNLSGYIKNAFLENPELSDRNIKRSLTKNKALELQAECIKELTIALQSTHSKAVIISAEGILSLNGNELLKLRNFLALHCQSIRVIGYVRPPIAYMQSALQQLAKQGIASSFVSKHLNPSYRNRFRKCDSIFGRKNVLLLKYDSKTLLNNNVVLDFCLHTNIPINPDSIIRANESLSLEALSLLYAYYRFGVGYGSFVGAIQENNQLIEAVSRIGNKKIRFSPNLAQSLLENNREDIQWMEKRLGCSLHEVLEDSKDNISSEDDLLDLSTKYAENLKQLLFCKMPKHRATPQKIADWMHLLRQQLSKSNPKSNQTQLSNSKIKHLKEKDSLIQQEIDKTIHNEKVKISFNIGRYQNGYLQGWILDELNPAHKLSIELHCKQGLIGKGVADRFRQDLADAKIGDGQCSFKIKANAEIKDFGTQIIIKVVNYGMDFFVNRSLITKDSNNHRMELVNSTHKPDCILHIGMHKTGTSSIQQTLSKQQPCSEFKFIDFGTGGNSSSFFYNIFSEKAELHHRNQRAGLSKNQILDINKSNVEKLKSVLENTKSRLIIISGEGISLLEENEIYSLKEFLNQYCKSIRIIGYVRPPISYLQSSFQQNIKNGFVDIKINRMAPNYRKRFEKFDNVFGKKNVLLFKYDTSKLSNSDVVLDFCLNAGIEISPKSIIRVNNSFSLEATSLLYVYYKYGNDSLVNRRLIEVISNIGNKKVQFASDLSQSILEKNLNDIRWMEMRLGCSLTESLEDSLSSLSSIDDLLALSVKCADDLKKLLHCRIPEQPATPQKLAHWLHLLRQQLENQRNCKEEIL